MHAAVMHARAAIVALLLAASGAAIAIKPPPNQSLSHAVGRHLDAINARDLDALLATVTKHPIMTTILPDGRVLETREEYRKLHVAWFAERGWRMNFKVQDITQYGDVGIARVKYDSQVRNKNGRYISKRVALLSLTFRREEGAWRLVYDQNTVIPSPDKK